MSLLNYVETYKNFDIYENVGNMQFLAYHRGRAWGIDAEDLEDTKDQIDIWYLEAYDKTDQIHASQHYGGYFEDFS
jgi:hypothetical protein